MNQSCPDILRVAVRFTAILGLGFAGLVDLRADVKMSAIFGDHMVLQQDLTLPVWGWADPGEEVTVTLQDQRVKTLAGADGRWRVNLKKMPADLKPLTMTVSGKNTLTFNDVLVGDVWVCSGQSNMVMGFYSSAGGRPEEWEKFAKADFPLIRFFFVTKAGKTEPLDALAPPPLDAPLQGTWQVCSQEMLLSLCDHTPDRTD